MSEQNKKKEVSQNEEKNVSREMTEKEMEQVTGGAQGYIGKAAPKKWKIYTGK